MVSLVNVLFLSPELSSDMQLYIEVGSRVWFVPLLVPQTPKWLVSPFMVKYFTLISEPRNKRNKLIYFGHMQPVKYGDIFTRLKYLVLGTGS